MLPRQTGGGSTPCGQLRSRGHLFPCLGWQGPLGALPGCVKVHTGSHPHPCKPCFIYILICTMKPFILTALCLLGVTVVGDKQDSMTPALAPGARQGLGGISIPRLAAVLAVTSTGPHCSEGTPSPEQQSESCAHRGCWIHLPALTFLNAGATVILVRDGDPDAAFLGCWSMWPRTEAPLEHGHERGICHAPTLPTETLGGQ